MSISVSPYVHFANEARTAMEFYRSVFDGELTISTFAEFGLAEGPAGEGIMHSQLIVGGDVLFMAADTPPGQEVATGSRVDLALFGGPEDLDTMTTQWERLKEGATVLEELAAAPWGDVFGMLVDKFGILWQVNVASQGE